MNGGEPLDIPLLNDNIERRYRPERVEYLVRVDQERAIPAG
jgi:hypothetical protein